MTTLALQPVLSRGKQLGLAALVVVLFLMLGRGSALGMIFPVAAIASFLIVRTPSASVLAYIAIDIFLVVRGRSDSATFLDLLCGALFMGISLYWVVRIRLIDWQPLTSSAALLTMFVFYVWSLGITAVGLTQPHHDPNDAIREVLNLLPLVILPILYERYIEPHSPTERKLFWAIPILGVLMIGWNGYILKTHLAAAVYLFQLGRASSDATLSFFLAMLASSFLMIYRRSWKAKIATLILLASTVGVIISISRALYLALLVGVVTVYFLADRNERKQARKQWVKAVLLAIGILLPFLMRMRIVSLLIMNYLGRFVSTKNLKSDLSLVNRYVEWQWLWKSIKVSPIIGFGFGAHFRGYSVIEFYHYWLSFSHSSYLYLVFKTGIVGALLFLGSYFAFTYKGFVLAKSTRLSAERRAIMRAGVAFLVGFLVDCYSSPDLDSKTDMVWIGLLWGFFLSTEKWLRRHQASATEVIGQTPNDPALTTELALT